MTEGIQVRTAAESERNRERLKVIRAKNEELAEIKRDVVEAESKLARIEGRTFQEARDLMEQIRKQELQTNGKKD